MGVYTEPIISPTLTNNSEARCNFCNTKQIRPCLQNRKIKKSMGRRNSQDDVVLSVQPAMSRPYLADHIPVKKQANK